MTKSSPKDRIERVLSSVPANATASRVMSGGVHYDPEVKEANHTWHSYAPPPLKAINREPIQSREIARQLIGRKFGSLTVIDLADIDKGGGTAKWAVRCVCGYYEVRNARAIRNPANRDDACQRCVHERKAKYRYETLGARSIAEFADGRPGGRQH